MKKILALFFLIAGVGSFSFAQQKYALVIGNAEYQRIDKLKNTVNDAEDISAALRGLGYQVELKRNLGHLDMVDAIEAFAVKLASNRANEGFFWYAGHAVQIRDENYLLPVDVTVDTEPRVRAGSFSLNNLIDMLDGAHNKVNVLILDACRDNPLPATGRGGGGRGLAMIRDVPSDLFVMFSTAPGDKADDGAAGKRNSPFAEAFLKYIKSNEPVYQMAIDVTQETLSLTGQRQRPFQRGSIISEKYYSLNPQAGQAASQAAVQPVPQSAAVQPAPQPAPVATGNAKDHYDKGVLFFDRDDYDIAILELTEAIRLDPNFAEAYAYRSRSYNGKENYDQGLIDAERAIRINPQLALPYYSRGNAYLGKNDNDKAIADYTQAIRIDPNHKDAYSNRGILYYLKSDYDKAIADLTQAIRIDPNNDGVHHVRGVAYTNKGDYDKAIADFTQAIRLNPNDAIAYNNRGYAYKNKKDYDKAIADFTQAIRLNPNDANAYNNRGDAYKAKGDTRKANADYEKAKQLGYK